MTTTKTSGTNAAQDSSAVSGEAALNAALDTVYPIPDNPHTSVVQRAVNDRIAFRHGWQAALSQPVEAKGEEAAGEVPTYWLSQRKMIERAIIGLRDGWATRKDADDALSALAAAPAPQVQAAPGDFAKIVRASSGQQVLFFKEVAEDGNTMHCVANFDDFQSDLKMAGLPDDAFETALDKADVKMADQVLAQVAELGFGGAA